MTSWCEWPKVLTLVRAHCSVCRLYLFSFSGGKFEPSGWLFTEVIAFKILQSCLYKRPLKWKRERKQSCACGNDLKMLYDIQIHLQKGPKNFVKLRT